VLTTLRNKPYNTSKIDKNKRFMKTLLDESFYGLSFQTAKERYRYLKC
jgi:hypothetical protein